MYIFLTSCFFFLVFWFFFIIHPFYMSGLLVILSFSLSFLIYNISDHWLNLVILMIYLGGVLVLFIYVASVLPNLKLSYYNQEFLILWWFMMVLMTIAFSWFYSLFLFNLYSSSLFFKFLLQNWNYLMLLLFFLLLVLIIAVEFFFKKTQPLRFLYL